ncbi:MAG: TadE/TadG family type IV pilus assembly protein [Clostridiaceae bacterium]
MKKLDNKGNASIIVCLMISAILGFVAYVVDIGIVYSEKEKLSNAIDSAALAASLELPNDDIKARTVAIDYVEKNGVDRYSTVISISEDHKSVGIYGAKNIKHFFAPIIGINDSDIDSKTKAIIAPVKSVKDGVRPFAVVAYDYPYGALVTLKEGAGDGYNGNYGAIALGGQGANVFKTNALYGYNGTISVGDYIKTETGDMAGASNAIKNYIESEKSTFDNFPRDSIRLWIIPLVDTLQVNGRGEIQIVGFACFYVENVANKSGKIEISGRFVRYVMDANVDETLKDTGAYGAKLSE